MYYIFNANNICICSCDYAADQQDLLSRNEVSLESEELFDISKIKLENGKIVPIPTDIQEIKDNKKSQLKVERDHRETLPIEYKGKSFDYDDKARERMRIAQQALEDNNIPSQTWTCADNSTTELTVADFKALNTLAAQRSGQLHERYNKLKTYIDTLKTVEAIEAVTFDTEVK